MSKKAKKKAPAKKAPVAKQVEKAPVAEKPKAKKVAKESDVVVQQRNKRVRKDSRRKL